MLPSLGVKLSPEFRCCEMADIGNTVPRPIRCCAILEFEQLELDGVSTRRTTRRKNDVQSIRGNDVV